jgi:hypothetical protein
MKSLQQFKAEIGVTEIKLDENQKGRKMKFIYYKDKDNNSKKLLLLVSTTCDLDKPLYVNQITEDKDGTPITDEVYVLFNTKLKDAGITI